MSNAHLVILKKQYLDKILDGSKTIESRLMKGKCAPFDCVSTGDVLFFKQSAGPVVAKAQAAAVKQFSNLTPQTIAKLKTEYNDRIRGEEGYWQMKAPSRYAVLVKLKNVETIPPRRIYKKDWRAWVVLKKPNDFGLL
ncbi:MAG: ASCH domain-containing protein [Phycisphaerae bacterium]|nr:ASCH domain-containing protein [Phycisphaerae bacterium]